MCYSLANKYKPSKDEMIFSETFIVILTAFGSVVISDLSFAINISLEISTSYEPSPLSRRLDNIQNRRLILHENALKVSLL